MFKNTLNSAANALSSTAVTLDRPDHVRLMNEFIVQACINGHAVAADAVLTRLFSRIEQDKLSPLQASRLVFGMMGENGCGMTPVTTMFLSDQAADSPLDPLEKAQLLRKIVTKGMIYLKADLVALTDIRVNENGTMIFRPLLQLMQDFENTEGRVFKPYQAYTDAMQDFDNYHKNPAQIIPMVRAPG